MSIKLYFLFCFINVNKNRKKSVCKFNELCFPHDGLVFDERNSNAVTAILVNWSSLKYKKI